MLIPIHVSFIDLLNGNFYFVYHDLVEENPNFRQKIKKQVYILNNLILVLGVSKNRLLKQLKKGMRHPDIPNDRRGLIKRRQDGQIDVIGLAYDTLSMITFYKLEKKSSQIAGVGDEDVMERIFLREAARKLQNQQNPMGYTEPLEKEVTEELSSIMADYQGELTENHYGAQSIAHAMPSERNLSLGTAMIKIMKRVSLLYKLALADNKNINLPMGGPNPFWLGVIMHCVTDSYSTVHTFRCKYDKSTGLYHTLDWNPEVDGKFKKTVDPKFRKFVPSETGIYFSHWELKSTFSLFSRCLSNYFDHHFSEIYRHLNKFNNPEALIDFIVQTVCQNYCLNRPDSRQVFCQTCQSSALCRVLGTLDLFDTDEPSVETFDDAYQDMGPDYDFIRMPSYFRLEHFQNFVNGRKGLTPKQREIRGKVIEMINRLLFFKFREKELKDLFQSPGLNIRYREMISRGFVTVTATDQFGGDGLWDAFKSTVNDLFQNARASISSTPKLSQFIYSESDDTDRDRANVDFGQSYIIDFHDYEKQSDPSGLHMKCDFVQHPSLLEEIYDNLVDLTELYSRHINYLYKLKLKLGENIQTTFYDEYGGDISQIGRPLPKCKSQFIDEYNSRMKLCIEEFYHFIYHRVLKINDEVAFESQIKRFSINPETCMV